MIAAKHDGISHCLSRIVFRLEVGLHLQDFRRRKVCQTRAHLRASTNLVLQMIQHHWNEPIQLAISRGRVCDPLVGIELHQRDIARPVVVARQQHRHLPLPLPRSLRQL